MPVLHQAAKGESRMNDESIPSWIWVIISMTVIISIVVAMTFVSVALLI